MTKPDELLINAEKLLEKSQFQEVIGLLTEKQLDELENAELYFCRAWAHYQLGENDVSKDFSEKANAANPNLKDDLFSKGYNFDKEADYNKAINE